MGFKYEMDVGFEEGWSAWGAAGLFEEKFWKNYLPVLNRP